MRGERAGLTRREILEYVGLKDYKTAPAHVRAGIAEK